jgi:two-component sensor histidine kinase
MIGTTPAPNVAITDFLVSGQSRPVPRSKAYFPYNQSSLAFEFAALTYFRSQDNQYSYILEGADSDWVKASNTNSVNYSNLSPGEYTFRVKGANYTGAWSDPVSVSFVIRPPWYDTWWFRLLVVCLLGIGVYATYRFRMNYFIKVHAMRNKIASDLHDEVGSTLSSISLSSAVIQNRLSDEDPETIRLMQQVSENTESMMEAMSDIVWAINTRNDRFDHVVDRIRAFAIELLEPLGVTIHVDIGQEVVHLNLDMEQRKNLYLIFKEALNNIAKYSECKHVWIELEMSGRQCTLTARDDGQGFDLTAARTAMTGNGLGNMQGRADKLNGQLRIESTPGKGTIVCLTCML